VGKRFFNPCFYLKKRAQGEGKKKKKRSLGHKVEKDERS